MFEIPRILLGELMPFEDHIADDVVLMKNNAVLAMFAVEGVCPDAADAIDVTSWFEAQHNALKNIAAEDVELNAYMSRAEIDTESFQTTQHLDAFPEELDAAYREQLRAGAMYAVPLSLAVQIHPPNLAVHGITKLVSDPNLDVQGGVADRIERLTEICGLLEAQLAQYGLRRLGYARRGTPAIFDEIAETLVFAATGIWRPIPATTGRMGNTMLSEDVAFRGIFRWRRYIRFEGGGRPYYASMFALKDYPLSTWPGILNPLLNASYRCTIAQSFRFLSNAAADGALNRKQNKRLIAGDKSHSQTADLDIAANQLINREWVLGDHSILVIAFADTRAALDNVSHAVWRDMAACGLSVSRMNGTLRAAWLSMFPGGVAWRPRPGFVSSRNLCAFSPFYNWPKGAETSHWPGPPIAIFRTLGGTPYKFHWHIDDVGNTLVTGRTGSGKTTLVAFLIAMTAGRARIIALDHKRGWQFLIRHLRGDYAVLGAGQPHFAPLKALDNTPANIEFLIELFRGCIGGQITEEEGRRMALGFTTVMELPSESRSIRELRAFLPDDPEGAGARLEKWEWGNELGWVLDAPKDTVSFGRVNGFDTTALLANERARGAALVYLFYRILLCLDGTPTLIPSDETWRAFADPIFREMLEKLARTIRSKNGAMVFITQSPSDTIESGIARILIEQCLTQIHLANPRGSREDYVDGFKLTEGQYDAFHALPTGQGYFLLIQGDNSVLAQLPMRGMTKELKILSASEHDLTADRQEMLEAAD